jgi:hypothetical protein
MNDALWAVSEDIRKLCLAIANANERLDRYPIDYDKFAILATSGVERNAAFELCEADPGALRALLEELPPLQELADSIRMRSPLFIWFARAYRKIYSGAGPIHSKYASMHELALVRVEEILRSAIRPDDGPDMANANRRYVEFLSWGLEAAEKFVGDLKHEAVVAADICAIELPQAQGDWDLSAGEGVQRVSNVSDIPAEFRYHTRKEGDPLTAEVIERKYDMSHSHLSKRYRGPRLKLGRKYVYRHKEIATLTDQKQLQDSRGR